MTSKDVDAKTDVERLAASPPKQLMALVKRMGVYQKRQRYTNCCQLSIPAMFLLLLTLLQSIVDSNLDDFAEVEGIPDPSPSWQNFGGMTAGVDYFPTREEGRVNGTDDPVPGDGAQLYYAPGSTDADALAAAAPAQLLPPGPEFFSYDSKADMEEDILDHWRGNLEDPAYRMPEGGYIWVETPDIAGGTFKYAVGYNESNFYSETNFVIVDDGNGTFVGVSAPVNQNVMVSYMNSAILAAASADAGAEFEVGLAIFPTQNSTVTFDLVALVGPTFYMWILQFQLPVVVGLLVHDKQNKLLDMMKMVGLKMSIYYIANWTFGMLIFSLAVLIMYVYANTVTAISFFTDNAPSTILLFFFGWSQAMLGMSFMMAAFFKRQRPAAIISYLWVIFFSISVGIFVGSWDPVEDADALAVSAWIPPFALYRGLTILADAAAGDSPGLDANEFASSGLADFFWRHLLVGWLLIAGSIVVEQALSPQGLSAWSRSSRVSPGTSIRETNPGDAKVNLTDEGADVIQERKATFEGGSDMVLRVLNLAKTYPGNPPKEAVRGVSFNVKQECFGLLGPNGAGKSTTISMLSGLLGPTSGTGQVANQFDIASDLAKIYPLMGVCPQDNILWDDLTAREHLLFYGRLRNLSGAALEAAVVEALKNVDLFDVQNNMSRTYSGGMKRRLSVAIAFIGEPMLVFLDEPTTGLDPAMRQQVWKIIHNAKGNRGVVLTTHSMEEAEALCDRICIMTSGSVKVVGHVVDLKRRYGSGFSLTVTSAAGRSEEVAEYIKSTIPTATVDRTIANVVRYTVPRDGFNLAQTFEELEANKDAKGIVDWGITQTTLEDVFLAITRNSEAEG